MNAESANLDFLRAIAVLCVFADHLCSVAGIDKLFPLLDFWNLGRVGVLLFFVHTSLVLMMSLERQNQRSPDDKIWLRFMIRRVFRIYPLSLLAVLVTVFFRIPTTHSHSQLMDYVPLSTTGFVSNLLLIQNLTFSPSAPGPLWSLPYEIQMYICLPLFFLLARRISHFRTMVYIWLGSVMLALLQSRLPHISRLDVFQFAPCFLPGIIAFWVIRKSPKRRLPSWSWLIVVLSIVFLYAAIHNRSIIYQWAVGLATGLLIPQFKEINNWTVRYTSKQIAKYSYGIYLSHVACIWLGFVVCRGFSSPVQWSVVITSSIILPVLLYTLLEHPFIRLGTRVAFAGLGTRPRKMAASASSPIISG